MEQKPSIGRIVHFNSDNGLPAHKVAAIITQVNPADGKVSLCIIGATGMGFRFNIEQGNEAGQWNWPERV